MPGGLTWKMISFTILLSCPTNSAVVPSAKADSADTGMAN